MTSQKNTASIVSILVVLALCISVGSIVTISLYSRHQHQQALHALSDQFINQIQETVIEKTSNYLMPAIILAENSAKMVQFGALSLANTAQIENYALSVLTPYPQLSAFYYGDAQGNFTMLKRQPDGTIQTKLVRPKLSLTKFKDRNPLGQITTITPIYKVDFDPRKRPWYVGAQTTDRRFWTDVYVFFSNKQPGITASYPVYSASNHFKGVFGVDIELSKISELLAAQSLGSDSHVLITNEKNKVVAMSKHSDAIQTHSHFVQPLHVKDLPYPEVTMAFEKFASNAPPKKIVYQANQKEYVAAFQPFPAEFGKKWHIVIVAPTDTLIQAPKLFNRSLIAIIFCLIVLSLIGVFVIASLIATPIKLMTVNMRSASNEKFSIKSKIREIHALFLAYRTFKS